MFLGINLTLARTAIADVIRGLRSQCPRGLVIYRLFSQGTRWSRRLFATGARSPSDSSTKAARARLANKRMKKKSVREKKREREEERKAR